jgi:hypothetical protein
MSKLTDFQEKLINDLRKEFDKLNVKNEVSSSSNKFSFATIQNCIDEEARFREVVTKHNLKMIDAFKKMMLNEFKAFGKEFGKVIDLKYEYSSASSYVANTFDTFIDSCIKSPLNITKSNEMNLYLVSKVKFITYSESRWNYFNNAKYFTIHIDFKCENVSVELESGKKVVLPKIIGVQYLTSNWLKREDSKSYSSLDEMIQMDKEIQRRVVELVQG